jgi:hypothetical protein
MLPIVQTLALDKLLSLGVVVMSTEGILLLAGVFAVMASLLFKIDRLQGQLKQRRDIDINHHLTKVSYCIWFLDGIETHGQ